MFLQIYSKKESFLLNNSSLQNIELFSSLFEISLSLFYFHRININNVNSLNDYLFVAFHSEVSFEFSTFENFGPGFFVVTDSNVTVFNDNYKDSRKDNKLIHNSLIVIQQMSEKNTFSMFNTSFIGFSSNSNGTVYLRKK